MTGARKRFIASLQFQLRGGRVFVSVYPVPQHSIRAHWTIVPLLPITTSLGQFLLGGSKFQSSQYFTSKRPGDFLLRLWAMLVMTVARPRLARYIIQWAVSSAVERLVYTEMVGGSIPSLPTIFLWHR